jgi:hypothetical protein
MINLPTIPQPEPDLSKFDSVTPSTATREQQREFIDIAATVSDEFFLLHMEKLAEAKFKFNAATFKRLVKDRRDTIVAQRAEAARKIAEAEGAKAVSPEGEAPLFFDGERYYRKENDGCYGTLCREDALLHLAVHGYNLKREDGSPSPADFALHKLQSENRVAFAGPICGRSVGLYTMNEARVLCTSSPSTMETKEGPFPRITAYIESFLGAGKTPLAVQQRDILEAWIKLGRVAVKNPHRYLPGQILTIVGPANCGKSMFQKLFLTPAFGGRVANPGQWLVGKTTFNSEMWGAEHLALGDSKLGRTGAEREDFRDALKEIVASPDYPFHPKNKPARTMTPIWRISMTTNMESSSLNHLPAMNGSFDDKIIILQGYSPDVSFWDENDPEGRLRFEAGIKEELPAYFHYIDNKEIPSNLKKGRFGVTEWHHPEILAKMILNTPKQYAEYAVEKWITEIAKSTDPVAAKQKTITMHAGDIFKAVDHDDSLSEANCKNALALGHLLAEMSEKEPWLGSLVTKRVGNHNAWEFKLDCWREQ